MDPNEFRDQVEREIAAAQPVAQATTVDESADAATQAATILALGSNIVDDDALFSRLLQRLADTNESVEVRSAILDAVQAQSFQTGRFARRAADWTAALRGLTRDPNQDIRVAALSTLSNDNDPQAQDLLIGALRDPANGVIAPVVALQLLSNDVHTEVFPLARGFVDNPPDEETKIAALRVLAADSQSVDLFTGLVNNASESSDVRIFALSALNSLSPDAFVANAGGLVMRGDNDANVVAASLVALSLIEQELAPDLLARIAALANSGTGDAIQLAAAQAQERFTNTA